ncbi:hypothetical protein BO83DRAFT_176076 [Aspergillus eucalypticola CBS 122712]|uniref:Uncharacterized protein n=1 Tax=Aspergillus eucalypticola (strain CBS 122712 / IBT 29274) TaxID=1448314 RepID=A0A317W6V0_ASPEC|nr:uncharacterized protein BO83DRAFT_176076 [Aspergillus eucalypticola CBS 122712]PWY81401.1 hypothetical protein BO83DRAFT_176076 [Aspergillus eucalypticola CBS 122712]
MAHDKLLLCDLFGRTMLPIGCIRPIQIRVHQDPTTCSRNYSPEAHTSSTSHDGMASNNDENPIRGIANATPPGVTGMMRQWPVAMRIACLSGTRDE